MTPASWLQPLPTASAMRAADAGAIAAGVPGTTLMERAGAGLARVAAQLLPAAGPIAVLCGKGNNGGDGFVAARLLKDAGRDVRVFITVAPDEVTGDAAHHLARLTPPPSPLGGCNVLDGCTGAIDALLGTGVSGPPHGLVAHAIGLLNASALPVVACDVPSGVDGDTGAIPDPQRAVQAIATVTFAAATPGLWIAPGKAHAGAVHVIDIGVLPDAAPAGLLNDDGVLAGLPSRTAASTKFTSGHVVVCGGSRGMTGAVCLTAEAAVRAGGGYVTACVPRSLEAIFEVKLTEVMTRALPDSDGDLTGEAADVVLDALAAHGGILTLGGGLGRTDGALACARAIALRVPAPLVLDADAIAAFAGDADALSVRAYPTLVTPHAGELGRLLGTGSRAVQAQRLSSAREAARRSGAIVVLKGDDTLVASPDGRVAVSEGGAPALATAGTGDVLTGICGAFLAAGLEPWHAACAGVRAHVLAGRAAATAYGPDGVVAGDVIAALPGAVATARYAERR